MVAPTRLHFILSKQQKTERADFMSKKQKKKRGFFFKFFITFLVIFIILFGVTVGVGFFFLHDKLR